MSDEHKAYASTAAATLEAHIMSVRSAKSEAEWWAQREIERLRAELDHARVDNEKLRAALKPLTRKKFHESWPDLVGADMGGRW